MKTRKNLITALAMFMAFGSLAQTLTPKDLAPLLGMWEGKLTYVNYNDDTKSSINANLSVNQKKDPSEFYFADIYPNEKSANSNYKIVLSKDGTKLNKETITSTKRLEDGTLEVILEFDGKDNGKSVLIRKTYLLGKETLIIRKDILEKKATEWFTRNQYNYTRAEEE